MRAARLIRMVLLLQSRPSMTAAELARELEVSERTVARDVLSLSEAGVPVYADRGRAGGYRLIGGYRTRLTGLGRSEVEALFLSGVPAALRDMGLADAASAARLKVSAALLPELRDAADGAAQRFHLDAPAWYREPATPELLPAVADAVWDDRRVAARYRRKDTEVERELEPYGLVLKAGVWYLAARAGEDVRVYRIDRFTSVTLLDDRFTRDPDFDLPAFWAERAAQFARSILRDEVTVRLTPAGARQLRHVTDRAGADEALAAAGEPDEQGRITVTLPVESLDVAFSQLLGLGPEGEVLAPAALRERFAEAAARTYGLYRES
ncbi:MULTISPECIES: helix-turn-helix transcriptional regulator [Streptomyces]|uniref:YafY family transcriptional regulator n=2 Tax=Streptomyces rimosus subsp. rimosus TaxID=132474 RepID=L8EMG3_STRR1|nr:MULTISPECIES: YafY family protein [Streptomyces]KOG76122.1 transcriptional regulator [Kitasatospora aureofaciens]MYT44452.1 WYL domain-containing protein [Streptomyces sp. SID5471]KEF07688.1 transcriptional regulator [Streptomyces rimosus]KOT42414.1 transcriptional regulator [Streptomyces sp. NRRL WC-3701]KOT44559.1 transcriptional regulator [Streptomyces rimosus subsp. rimosus]